MGKARVERGGHKQKIGGCLIFNINIKILAKDHSIVACFSFKISLIFLMQKDNPLQKSFGFWRGLSMVEESGVVFKVSRRNLPVPVLRFLF